MWASHHDLDPGRSGVGLERTGPHLGPGRVASSTGHLVERLGRPSQRSLGISSGVQQHRHRFCQGFQQSWA
jgi:hypothetical protein